LAVKTVIRKEEDFLWLSFKELLGRIVQEAARKLQGIFEFNLLAFEIERGTDHFYAGNFTELLSNHARKLAVGQEAFVKYGCVFGILKKRVKENWGMMDLVTAVETYTKDKTRLDLFIGKILRDCRDMADLGTVVIQDLSHDPVFHFGDEEQTARLAKMLGNLKQDGPSPSSGIYLLQGGSAVELFSQFGLA